MKHITDNLLSGVEKFTESLGPITTLFDSIVERIAPKAKAQASCSGYYCFSACSLDCCAWCFFGWDEHVLSYAYANNPANCGSAGFFCSEPQGCGSC